MRAAPSLIAWLVSIPGAARSAPTTMEDVQSLVDAITLQERSPLGYRVKQPSAQWADYRRASSACTRRWKPAGTPVNYVPGWDTDVCSLAAMATHDTQPIPTHTCHLDEDAFGREWLLHRVGPFVVAPPASNTSIGCYKMIGTDLFDLGALLETRGHIYANTFGSVPLGGNLEPVGYPPLHNHHSQVMINRPDESEVEPRKLQDYHQDNTCSGGRLECNLVSFPEGVGAKLIKGWTLEYDALFNDVRASGSAPADFYVDLFMALVSAAEPEPQNVLQVRLESAILGWPSATVGATPFSTFPVPATLPSVYWTSWIVPLSGHALNIWLHTHEGFGYRETWVLRGSADQLGMRALPWEDDTWASDCSFVRVPSVPMKAIKLSILDKVQEKGLGIRCMGFRPASYSPSTGDVQSEWTCFKGSERYVKGEELTNIAFFEPSESDAHFVHGLDASQMPPSVLQHHHMQSYILPEDPTLSDHPYYLYVGHQSATASPYSAGTIGLEPSAWTVGGCLAWVEGVTKVPKNALLSAAGLALSRLTFSSRQSYGENDP